MEDTFECKLCGIPFITKLSLNEHLALHEEKPYVCQFCDKKFKSKLIFGEHQANVHKYVPDITTNATVTLSESKIINLDTSLDISPIKKSNPSSSLDITLIKKSNNQSSSVNFGQKTFFSIKELLEDLEKKNNISANVIKPQKSAHENNNLETKTSKQCSIDSIKEVIEEFERNKNSSLAINPRRPFEKNNSALGETSRGQSYSDKRPKSVFENNNSSLGETFNGPRYLGSRPRSLLKHNNSALGETLRGQGYSDGRPKTVFESNNSAPTGATPFECKKCEKFFFTKYYLDLHFKVTKIHNQEGNFQCTECPKAFVSEQKLRNHSKYHEEPRFKCPEKNCDKGFTNKSNLTAHVNTHLNLRPYKCEVCGKAFSIRCNLERHSYVHSGLKPYKCDLCPTAAYNDKYLLKKHKICAHPETLKDEKKSRPKDKGFGIRIKTEPL